MRLSSGHLAGQARKMAENHFLCMDTSYVKILDSRGKSILYFLIFSDTPSTEGGYSIVQKSTIAAHQGHWQFFIRSWINPSPQGNTVPPEPENELWNFQPWHIKILRKHNIRDWGWVRPELNWVIICSWHPPFPLRVSTKLFTNRAADNHPKPTGNIPGRT